MADIDNDSPELAATYDRVSDSQYENGVRLIEKMGIRAGDRVLDVGCGTGRLALHVAGVVGASGSVDGLDPSPHRIRVAGDRTAGNVTFAQGYAEDLGRYPDACFDAVYYNAVFHWIGDKKAALREAIRVLKPGGVMGLTTGCRGELTSTRSYLRQMAGVSGDRPAAPGTGRASMWLTKEEMEAMLAEAGFAGVVVQVTTGVKHFSSPEAYFQWLKASSPGHRPATPGPVRAEVRRRMAEALERQRTPGGIEVRSNRMAAIARRP